MFRSERRVIHQDKSGEIQIASTDDDQDLITAPSTGFALFLQRVFIKITTGSAGKTWQLEDGAGVVLAGPFDVGTSGTSFTIDFGDVGKKLTNASKLKVNISAVGAVGNIVWEAYRKQVATITAAALSEAV